MLYVVPVTVVEMPEFLSMTPRLMTDDERNALVDFLACNPTAGDLVPETGGLRKLRWALEGRGKRGGARVIHFFHSPRMPLFIITAYAKNEREDISAADRKRYRAFAKLVSDQYRGAKR